MVVFIDRGYKEFLIRVDYVGKNILILKSEVIVVKLKEIDDEDLVKIYDVNGK